VPVTTARLPSPGLRGVSEELLSSTVGGLLGEAFFSDSLLAAIVGAVLGAVVGLVLVLIWANQNL
jgi:hypothetical protein